MLAQSLANHKPGLERQPSNGYAHVRSLLRPWDCLREHNLEWLNEWCKEAGGG